MRKNKVELTYEIINPNSNDNFEALLRQVILEKMASLHIGINVEKQTPTHMYDIILAGCGLVDRKEQPTNENGSILQSIH